MRIAATAAISAASHPRRLQRSRKKGSKTPPGVIYCGRPTVLGNPFTSARFGHARCVALHRRWLKGGLSVRELRDLGFNDEEIGALARLRVRALDRIAAIGGRDLQCWCPVTSRWCHVDTILEIANPPVIARAA